MTNKKLNINCPINGTGYGITSLNIVKNLYAENKIDISLFPIGDQISVNSTQEGELIKHLINRNNTFDYNAPCLKIWHQFDLSNKIGNGHYYVFPFFEIDKITEREQHHLNYADFIFVASEWAKKVLLENNIKKNIFVAPLGVDRSIFSIPNKIRVEDNTYKFFHIGKWEHRKSHDFLIKAFSEAFDINDNVQLYLLPYNPFLKEEENNYWFKMVEESKLKDKIKIFGRLNTQYELNNFIWQCDCGVFLSRGEGWNNEIVESMSLSKPIIATYYSAHTEYLTKDNSFMVDVDEVEPAKDGKWFNGFGNWAKLGQKQLDQTIEYMRYVYNNHIDSNPSGLETAKYYSWNRTSSIINNTLEKNNSYYANTSTKRKRKR
jgi:glycosyltransferase involved in cell wall biosynthesis